MDREIAGDYAKNIPNNFTAETGHKVWCDRGMKEVRFAGRGGMLGPHSLPFPSDPCMLLCYCFGGVCGEHALSTHRTLQ